MPTYVFRDDATGETMDMVYPASAIPEQVEFDGKVFKRDITAEIMTQYRTVREGSRYIVRHHHKPIESDYLGVHPEQIPEALELAKKSHTKIDFKPDGTALFSSEKQKQEYADAHGFGKKGKQRVKAVDA